MNKMSMESLYKLSILVNMIDRVSGPAAKIGGKIRETTDHFESYSTKMAGMARDGVVLIGTGVQLASAAIAPVKATFQTQDALGELSSLGIQDLKALESAATDFSNTWAGTTKPEFLTAAYDIKSGIASLNDAGVAGFTSMAGETAKATKSTIAEMTSLFATGYGIYKDYYGDLTDLQFGEIFSAGISQSVKQFKTTGSGMAQAISALGASATSAMVPLEEQLSILGMLQATMSGSEAGTKYTAFLQSAAKAGGELGLSFTDASGQLKSMPEILGAMQGKFGDVLTAADKLELQKAFGTIEAVKLIELLYSKTDDLQGNIVSLYDTMGMGMSITEEMANKINAPPGQSWELLKQKLQTTLETVGNAMLPQFMELQKSLDLTANKVIDFANKHPQLISNIMFTIGAFGAFLTTLGVLKLGIGGIGTLVTGIIKVWGLFTKALSLAKYGAFLLQYGLFNLKGGLALLGKGFLAVIGKVGAFGAALLANPITWVVVGIVALIAALVLLYQNWDTVTAFLQGAWDSCCSAVMSGVDWVKGGFQSFLDFFGMVVGGVQFGVGSIKDGFFGVVGWIGEKIAWFGESGKQIITTFTEGIKSMAERPINAIRDVLQKIRNMLPFSDAKEGPLSQLTLSGSRVFTTFTEGMNQTAELPQKTARRAFGGLDGEKRAALHRTDDTQEASKTVRQTTIQQVIVNLKMSDMDVKTWKRVKEFVAQIEDNLNGDDPDADPLPAM